MHTPSFAVVMALTAATTLSPSVAHAQRVGQAPEARPGRPALYPGQPRVNLPGPRWGGKVRGRWYGGHYAPGAGPPIGSRRVAGCCRATGSRQASSCRIGRCTG
ncbi:hypothetical protein [Sphingomonas hankookensis]|uniref:hypothetical protein n=1 Tax=Sphingomonas hankookensis TaxID=563996 RepID=UPI003D301F9C